MLVDTSVWVEHLRRGVPVLSALLGRGEVECHPFIIGELALGVLRRRSEVLTLLQKLPQLRVASHDEVLTLVDQHRLAGRGIGWVDVHLLASSVLDHSLLWTRDKSLSGVAETLNICARP